MGLDCALELKLAKLGRITRNSGKFHESFSLSRDTARSVASKSGNSASNSREVGARRRMARSADAM
jgi:hypothetical protein